MLGLLDLFHAFVVLHRVRQRGRSRVTDVVLAETARIAMNTQSSRDSVKEKCAHRERGNEKEKNSGD